jgi:hypothetical protein
MIAICKIDSMEKKMQQINVRMDDELYQWLKSVAERERRTIGAMARLLLEDAKAATEKSSKRK